MLVHPYRMYHSLFPDLLVTPLTSAPSADADGHRPASSPRRDTPPAPKAPGRSITIDAIAAAPDPSSSQAENYCLATSPSDKRPRYAIRQRRRRAHWPGRPSGPTTSRIGYGRWLTYRVLEGSKASTFSTHLRFPLAIHISHCRATTPSCPRGCQALEAVLSIFAHLCDLARENYPSPRGDSCP